VSCDPFSWSSFVQQLVAQRSAPAAKKEILLPLDYRSTLTYISKQTTNDHRHAHHDQSQQFCAVLNVANSRRQLEASQSAGSGCNDRPVESDGKRLDSELNDDKDQRAAYSGQISGEIVSSRWCSDKQTSDRIQMGKWKLLLFFDVEIVEPELV